MARIELHDGKMRISEASSSFESALGHAPAAILGEVSKLTHVFGFPGSAEMERKLAAAVEACHTSEAATWEMPLLHADHHEVHFEHSVHPDPSDPNAALLVSRDITDRLERARLKAVQAAQEVLLRNFELSHDLVTQIEMQDGVASRIYSSKSHLTVLGHEPSTLIGDEATLTHLYTPDFIANELPRLVHAFEAGKIPSGFTGEQALKHTDGSRHGNRTPPHFPCMTPQSLRSHEVMFEYRVSLDSENTKRFILVFRDLTDRNERARHEKDARALRVGAVNVGFILCDPGPGLRIMDVNPAWCAITGYSREEAIGKPGGSSFLQGPKSDKATVDAVRAAVRCRESISVDVLNYRKNGSTFWRALPQHTPRLAPPSYIHLPPGAGTASRSAPYSTSAAS